MRRQLLIAALQCLLFGTLISRTAGQTVVVNGCPYVNHLNSLACLVPDLTKTGISSNLSALNTTLAQVVGQLPLAVPVSGFVLGFDKSGIPIDINQNLGSVLTERGNTVGRHKLFLGFTFQRFVFHAVDGSDIRNLPTVFYSAGSGLYGSSSNSLGANVNQYTAVAAFGITDRIDISATLPFQRVSLYASHGLVQEFNSSGNQGAFPTCPPSSTDIPSVALCPQAVAGSASGPGDLLINVKTTVVNGERSKVAAGVETRFPTGDELNLLGTGAFGFKPYVVYSRVGRITPHANLGYQWNSFSDLNRNASGGNLRLPDSLDYSVGADIGLVKKLTLVTDLVGQHFFNSPKVTHAVPASSANIPGLPVAELGNSPTIGVATGSLGVNNLAIGLKVNPTGRMIISANVLIRLDSGGLRPDRFVPLAGISYRF